MAFCGALEPYGSLDYPHWSIDARVLFYEDVTKSAPFLKLERYLEESLSSSGQIALANHAGGDYSKTHVVFDVVQVVRTADLHSV
jgi:hypothetical protein